ncbi:hypothetical protein [Neobacillus sp. NPDC093127]|uniref:hypothetical protein n=1 Tax=Neobacillus sp. NPDC093127 TaxID=3364296 RepID=UPI00381E4BCF
MEEILQQILKKLDELSTDVKRLESKVDSVDNKVDNLKSSIGTDLTPYIEKNVQHIDESNERIIRYVDDKTDALNKRVFAVETDIQRLTRQYR